MIMPHKRQANFEVIRMDDEKMIIRDMGPWDLFPTVTNAAEMVVEKLAPILHGRRLFYYDSEGELDELLVENGKFNGFAPGPRPS